VPDGAQPPRAPRLVGLVGIRAEVRGEALQPRLVKAVVDDVEQ